ncbi:MAG TPA: hypothetical protein VF988_00185 [Verrucomicrobiae bacterium]
MRAVFILLALLALVVPSRGADAVSGKIVKVLPFFLDQHGRDALSPSLFDRDAYQARLRQHTNLVSGMRFDVQWTARKAADQNIKIALELRGIGTNSVPKLQTIETNVVAGRFHRWTALPLVGDDYRNFGSILAWRVTLWNNGQLLGEQKSFLW